MIRVIVLFKEDEVALLDRAVARLNKKPGMRATRSDIVRSGATEYAERILQAENGAASAEKAEEP